jgi:hypothetical protein
MLLGAQLVAEGLCTPEDIEDALTAQARLGGRLGSILVELGVLDVDVVASALGRQRRVPPAMLHHFRRIDAPTLARIPRSVAEKYGAIPIGVPPAAAAWLAVAMIDPFVPGAVQALATIAKAPILPMIAPEMRILQSLNALYGVPWLAVRPTPSMRRPRTIPRAPVATAPGPPSTTKIIAAPPPSGARR